MLEDKLGEEVRRYIEEHIDEFAREGPGWHMEMAKTIVDDFGLPIEEIDVIRDMVHVEAQNRQLPPYNDYQAL